MLSPSRFTAKLAVQCNILVKLTGKLTTCTTGTASATNQHARHLRSQSYVCQLAARSISSTSCALRRVAKVDEIFIDREYDKAKAKLDPEEDEPDPKDIIQIMERDQTRRQRAMKKAMTARLFPQPKEDRMLTWDTMDQIRFLKQEQPDEWTVRRLADSFNVSKAAIIKVLKTKFVPSEKAIKKQDLKVKINLGLLPPGTAIKDVEEKAAIDAPSAKLLTGNIQHSQKLLPEKQASHSKLSSGNVHTSNMIDQQRLIMENSQRTGNFQIQKTNKSKKHKYDRKSPQNQKKVYSKKSKKRQSKQSQTEIVALDVADADAADADVFGSHGDEDDDSPPEYDDDTPMKVTQKGREFYDEDGELLYRI